MTLLFDYRFFCSVTSNQCDLILVMERSHTRGYFVFGRSFLYNLLNLPIFNYLWQSVAKFEVRERAIYS